MRDRRLYFLENYDWVRKGLMFEPRGHDMMSGSILYPPEDPTNDSGILFIETSGCLPMCGHGTIGTVTIAIEEGLIVPKRPGKLRLETPAGLVNVEYVMNGGEVASVKLVNVPSFLEREDVIVEVPGLGQLGLDVAYGGNFYGIVDVQDNFPGMEHYSASRLIEWGRWLRETINASHSFVHPEDPSICGLSHIMWTGAPTVSGAMARNAVCYGDNAIDRSPCGTGTSARMAQWFAKGKLKEGDVFIHESIIGSTFTGKVEGITKVGNRQAIVPSIEGWAKITGYNTIIIDDEGPYPEGFQVL